MRVIVHPGFHKTGTSTIQVSLREARAQIPGWIIALPEDIRGTSRAAAQYARNGDPLELGMLQAAVVDWLDDQAVRGVQGILISNERMAGPMPGATEMTDYRAAPALMGAMAQMLRSYFGTKLDLHFLLSIREKAGWIDSLHWQLVRTDGLSEPLAHFRERLSGFEIAPTLDAIRAEIGPAQLHVAQLEDLMRLDEGPLTPILDLMNLSPTERAAVALVRPQNSRPRHVDSDALSDALAVINARGLSPEAAEAARRDLLRVAWREDAVRAQTND